MMRLARTWRNSIPRNSPRPGSRSKIDSSNNAGWAPGWSASGHRSCESDTPARLVEHVFARYLDQAVLGEEVLGDHRRVLLVHVEALVHLDELVGGDLLRDVVDGHR